MALHSEDISQCRDEVKGVQTRIQNLATDAARQMKAERLPKAAQCAFQGAQPSLDGCCSGLQDIRSILFLIITP